MKKKDSKKDVNEPTEIKIDDVDTEEEVQAAEQAPETETEAPPESTPEEQIAELNDRYLRLAAEFDNYKKRTAREWSDRVKSANSDLLYDLLDIIDNFERALAIEHPDSAYAKGVKLIFQQLQSLLERQGVSAVPALGEPFDPELHDALIHMDSDEYDEGIVCQEIRRGYKLHDRVLRHAQVAVSKGAPAESNEQPENNENE